MTTSTPATTEINSDTMTIEQALTALNYAPVAEKWDAKDDKQKWSEITKKKNEQEVKSAKAILHTFATSDAVAKLPKEVVASMLRLSKAPSVSRAGKGGSKNPFMDAIRGLFTKKGVVVSEIDVFVATKMGRGEMRAKVRQNLKSAVPAERMWIEFNADTESWKLLSIGEAQPKGWAGKEI